MRYCFLLIFGVAALQACTRSSPIGIPPPLTPTIAGREQTAMLNPSAQRIELTRPRVEKASLWTRDQGSLLGDRRALKRGDILTVVIEIDDEAEISNRTERGRDATESLNVPQLLGLPQRVNTELPEGASSADAVAIQQSNASSGQGSVRRAEKLTLRIAATILDTLPNGVLSIEGRQEVRVNFELRELTVQGFVRPQDISRRNEITYDKIASARISYGGRGQITDMQQPRLGQQILDAILPF